MGKMESRRVEARFQRALRKRALRGRKVVPFAMPGSGTVVDPCDVESVREAWQALPEDAPRSGGEARRLAEGLKRGEAVEFPQVKLWSKQLFRQLDAEVTRLLRGDRFVADAPPEHAPPVVDAANLLLRGGDPEQARKLLQRERASRAERTEAAAHVADDVFLGESAYPVSLFDDMERAMGLAGPVLGSGHRHVRGTTDGPRVPLPRSMRGWWTGASPSASTEGVSDVRLDPFDARAEAALLADVGAWLPRDVERWLRTEPSTWPVRLAGIDRFFRAGPLLDCYVRCTWRVAPGGADRAMWHHLSKVRHAVPCAKLGFTRDNFVLFDRAALRTAPGPRELAAERWMVPEDMSLAGDVDPLEPCDETVAAAASSMLALSTGRFPGADVAALGVRHYPVGKVAAAARKRGRATERTVEREVRRARELLASRAGAARP